MTMAHHRQSNEVKDHTLEFMLRVSFAHILIGRNCKMQYLCRGAECKIDDESAVNKLRLRSLLFMHGIVDWVRVK